MTLQEQRYRKYEYLAVYYAKKIWNTGNIGMDREDIEQELKLKLFTSIKMFGKKWAEYRKTGSCKPVPIEYYLKQCMINKSRDFIKDINKVTMIPMSSINFDYGKDQNSDIDVAAGDFIIDGFNVLDLFKGEERKMMKMKLKGIDDSKIEKVFRNSKFDPTATNKINLGTLRTYLKESHTEVREYAVSHYDE